MERSWVFFGIGAKLSSMRKAIAYRLARTEPVVVVERAVSALREPGRFRLKDRVDGLEYRPYHLPQRMRFGGQWSHRWNARRLRAELDRLRPERPRIVCYDSPVQWSLAGKLDESLSVYFAIDDRTVTVTGEPMEGLLRAERELLNRVDLVVCISDSLAEVLASRTPPDRQVPIQVIENGFDEELFNPDVQRPIPEALASLPRPWGLIAGHISERIDWDGLATLRQHRPDVHWVFLGPADDGCVEHVRRIGGSYFSPVPLQEVPAWIAAADVCAVPYRLNCFSNASFPLKAIEYLAMNKPVLATAIPCLRQFRDYIAFADQADGASYAQAVDRALAKRSQDDDQRAFVSPFQMQNRVDMFVDCIEQHFACGLAAV